MVSEGWACPESLLAPPAASSFLPPPLAPLARIPGELLELTPGRNSVPELLMGLGPSLPTYVPFLMYVFLSHTQPVQDQTTGAVFQMLMEKRMRL